MPMASPAPGPSRRRAHGRYPGGCQCSVAGSDPPCSTPICTSTPVSRARAAGTATSSTCPGGRCARACGLLGTGDFTHPAWAAELRKPSWRPSPACSGSGPTWRNASSATPRPAARERSGSALGRNLDDLPSRRPHQEGAPPPLRARLRGGGAGSPRALARIGNLASDGLPILGLDSRRDLLDITLSAGRAASWCPRTSGRRGSRSSAPSPASTRCGTATPTWPITSSRWRPGCPPTRR